MRCAVCGKEFGTGNNCQHCGSDKFTGLGNYCGYNAPVGNGNTPIQAEGIDNQSTNYLLQTENVGVIACYACGEIIPADSKFCPYCSKELFVTCPQCGHKYSSQFPACNQCGTNREKYYEQEKLKKEEERRAELERQKREEEERASIERLTREIEAKKKLKESTPEGRAELEREKRIMDQYREKWRNGGQNVRIITGGNYQELMDKIEANQKKKASTPEGRAELEREKKYIEECRKKWRNL
jgi:predicted  nucleic acid-binding Zn-ribbon protein